MSGPSCLDLHGQGWADAFLDEAVRQLVDDEHDSLEQRLGLFVQSLRAITDANNALSGAASRAVESVRRQLLTIVDVSEAESDLALASKAATELADSMRVLAQHFDALAMNLTEASAAAEKERLRAEKAAAEAEKAARRAEERREAERLQLEAVAEAAAAAAVAAAEEAAQCRAEELRRRQRLEEEAAAAAAATASTATVNATNEEKEEDDRLWRPIVLEAVNKSSADAATSGEFYDFGGYGCALRASESRLAGTGATCTLLPLHRLPLGGLPPTAELVGNAVRLELPIDSANRNQLARQHMFILMPHCAQRVASRETVIYVLHDEAWTELPSSETHIEGLDFQARWVEARLRSDQDSVIAVPANKLRTDRFRLGRGGLRYSSSVDSRVCLTVPEEAVKVQLDQAIEVQPIDSATLAMVKTSLPKETKGLLTCSSVVQHCSPKKNTLKPVVFSFPLPLNPVGFSTQASSTVGIAGVGVAGIAGIGGVGQFANGKRRPGTAADPKAAALATALAYRPLTGKLPALSRLGIDSHKCTEEFLILVGNEGAAGGSTAWELLTDAKLEEEPGKDIVSFRTTKLCDRRFMAFRIRPDFNTDMISRICDAIERSSEEKSACFIIRQKPENLREVMVALTMVSKLDRTMRHMQDCGYSSEPNMYGSTEEIKVRERQQFRLRFRGNIVSEDAPKGDNEFVMLFNSQMRGRLFIRVVEKDRFAQRAIDQYRGFLEVFTDAAVLKPGRDAKRIGVNGGSGVSGPAMLVTEQVNVARLLVCIPKSAEDLRVKSALTTPFSFRAKDAVTAEYLKHLSNLVCDSWELLAEKLDVSRKRCSVIKRNNDSAQQMAHEMLITWVKRLPVLKSKVQILSRALQYSGHPQLATNLRELEKELQENQNSMEN